MAEFERVNFVGYRDYASVSLESIKDDLTTRHKDILRAVRELKTSKKEVQSKTGDAKRQAIILGYLDQYISLLEGFSSDFARVVDDINRGVLTRDLEMLKQINKKAAVEEELGRHTFDALVDQVAAVEECGLLWGQIFSCILDTLFSFKDLGGLIKRLKVFVTPSAKKLDLTRAITPPPRYKGVSIPVPPGTKWKEVKIDFVGKDEIHIQAGSEDFGTKSYLALGFVDKRTKKKVPDDVWSCAFYPLGLAEGHIRFDDIDEHDTRVSLRKNISILRQRLKAMTGISENPFYPFQKIRVYKAKFKVSALVQDSDRHGSGRAYSKVGIDADVERRTTQHGSAARRSHAAEARNRADGKD